MTVFITTLSIAHAGPLEQYLAKHEPEIRLHAAEVAKQILLSQELRQTGKLDAKLSSEISELRNKIHNWSVVKKYFRSQRIAAGTVPFAVLLSVTLWGHLGSISAEHGTDFAHGLGLVMGPLGISFGPLLGLIAMDAKIDDTVVKRVRQIIFDEFRIQGLDAATIASDEALRAEFAKASLVFALVDNPKLLLTQIRQLQALLEDTAIKLETHPARQQVLRSLIGRLDKAATVKRWLRKKAWMTETFELYVTISNHFRSLIKEFELDKTDFNVSDAYKKMNDGVRAVVAGPPSTKNRHERHILRELFETTDPTTIQFLENKNANHLLTPSIVELHSLSKNGLKLAIAVEFKRLPSDTFPVGYVELKAIVSTVIDNLPDQAGIPISQSVTLELPTQASSIDAFVLEATWAEPLSNALEQAANKNPALESHLEARARIAACSAVATSADTSSDEEMMAVNEAAIFQRKGAKGPHQ